jgi:hypothetical protein
MIRDRPAVVALGVQPPEPLRSYLESLLRDEFADVKREAAADRERSDA